MKDFLDKQQRRLLEYLSDNTPYFDSLMGWKWSFRRGFDMMVTIKLRRFWYWLKTSFQYSIFLWHSGHDWDFQFLLNLLRFKLQRKYDFFMSDKPMISRKEEVAVEIKDVIDLIDRYTEEDFAQKETEEYHERWGEFDRTVFSLVPKNAKTETAKAQAKRDYWEVVQLADQRREACWTEIWDKMKKAQNWWD